MEKKLKIVVLLIAMSALYASTVFAQTGTAFFRPKYEYVMDPNQVWANFKENYQNAFGKGDFTCFQRVDGETPSVPAKTIVRTIAGWLKTQGHVASITGAEIAAMVTDTTKVTYDVVGSEYWLTHESAYFDTATGQVFWWNPTGTSIPELKKRKWWVIVHFHFGGRVVDIMGHCSNLVRAIGYNPGNGEEHFTENKSVVRATYNTDCKIYNFTVVPQQSDGPGQEVILSWSTSCPTVTISGFATVQPGSGQLTVTPNQTTTYILTTSSGLQATVTVAVLARNYSEYTPKEEKKGKFWKVAKPVAIVLGSAAIAWFGGKAVVKALKKSNDSGKRHNTDIQGTTGQGGASGGSGSQQSW